MPEYGPTKVCSRCREDLPRDAFYRNSGRPDGIQTVCRDCTRQNNRRWREDNPGAHLRHYAERPLTEAQREARRARAKRWYAENPERARENGRRWYAQNMERARAESRRRTLDRLARKREAFVESVDPLVVLERADGVCGICGTDVDPFGFEVDHITPLARGGEHSYANTQPAHPFCNRRKGARVLTEHLQPAAAGRNGR